MISEAKNQHDIDKPQAKGARFSEECEGSPGGKGVGTEETGS